ncbi:unnamed protein product [Caenorhabditis bovis]|uniref:RPGR-interacting protein 1 first C2 domain-containing protein n=1 Tax=Caenorhabditis bovis TaxID=2654633 RepID=A0A8S1EUK4_9PELO|nr:unnamed protein product [Caenorhabditis bovis]
MATRAGFGSAVSNSILFHELLSPCEVNQRYPIETWSRPQLEDRFHNATEEVQNLQKKVKDLEKQLTTFNSRFRRNLLERKHREQQVVEREKYDDLVKENQILEMKLKSAKHQLLIYTAPSARAMTTSAMTGRSTFRQPPSTHRQRPPFSGVSIDRGMPASGRKRSETELLRLGTDEKLTIVKLNRTLKTKNDEIAELKRTIEKLKEGKVLSPSKSSSENNNEEDEDDKKSIVSELSEMSSASSDHTPSPKKPKKAAPEPTRNVEIAAEKKLLDKLRIAENDLQLLKNENEVLKNANEKLIQQTLNKSTDYGEKQSIEDKKKVVELEEQLKDTEKRLKEAERRHRDYEKKIETLRQHYKAQTTTTAAQSRPASEPKASQNALEEPLFEETETKRRASQRELMRMRQDDDDLLSRLHSEVAEILKSHDVQIEDVAIMDSGEGLKKLARWQKMYSELYEELEKVRNMLVVQHDITQKQTIEISLLQDELTRLKTLNAEKLMKAKEVLEEKQKKIFSLEEQIRAIAYADQNEIPIISAEKSLPTTNTDLSIHLVNVRPLAGTTTKFFFSLEFFDFQLETTPIVEPKQQKMDFTTVYNVVVSNLLIHYLQTNGITIEMYKPGKDHYQLIAAGTVSLAPLLDPKIVNKYCSEIRLRSIDTGEEICILQYEIEVTQPFTETFKRFRKTDIARTMLPLDIDETEVKEEYEPLTVMVNRIQGLETKGKEYCVVYELLSFSPFFTDFSTDVEILAKRDISIPKTEATRELFLKSNISFYVIENVPKSDGVLAMLHLPLLPLLKTGGAIKGTFPMTDVSENASSLSLDICIMWKHEIPAFLPAAFSPPTQPSPPPPPPLPPAVQEVGALPPKRPSKQFDVSVVEELPDSPPKPAEERRMTQIVRTSSVQLLTREESQSPSSSPSPGRSESTQDVLSPPSKPTPLVFDYPSYPFANTKDDEEEIETVSAKSEDVPKSPPKSETPIPIEEKVSQPSSPEKQPESRSPSTPPTQRIAVDEEIISEHSIHSESPPQSAESMKNSQKDEIRSLLGVLPPIAKPRNNISEQQKSDNRNVVFTEPLHHSIPPSESSSTSSPRRAEKGPVALPEFEGHGVIKSLQQESPPDPTIDPAIYVTIRLEKITVVQYSRLLMKYFDDATFYIDWGFLDIPIETTRSTGFKLPRAAEESLDLDFEKKFNLTRRQVKLLEQWIDLSNRVDFTIIAEMPEEEEIGVAQLVLYRNNSDNLNTTIDFLDVNGEHLAELQLSLQYSPELLQRLR